MKNREQPQYIQIAEVKLKRFPLEARDGLGTRFCSPKEIQFAFQQFFDGLQEKFYCLYFDTKLKLLCLRQIAVGAQDHVAVDPKEIFRTALLVGSNRIILLHNHPSGDPSPSPEDRNLTSKLREAGKLFEIEIMDHVILGDGNYFSLQENN